MSAERGMRKKRVLHVIDSLDLGGAQVVLENLVRHADRERFDLEVAALHGPGVFTERLARLGVPVRALSSQKWLPWYVPRLLGAFAGCSYDVVHCHLLWANLIAKPLAAITRTPVRINHDHCNDKQTLRPTLRRLDRAANRISSHIIAVSESTRAGLLAQGISNDHVSTIYNGLDLELYQPRRELCATARERFGIPSDAFVVGGLGRLTFQKNFTLWVEAAVRAAKELPQAQFVIAGTGPDEQALKAQIAAHGMSNRIRLLGFVAEPTELYPALDLFLLTSRYEGLPMTILEAMACRVPIVASDLDGMREILQNGIHASLVNAGDAGAFARAVVDIANEPSLRSQRVDAALHLVRERYSAREMTRAVEAIYTRYLAE
jgi:glycosyltransferase involved in cell wall biosynthesis